jgi:hypothetical protein
MDCDSNLQNLNNEIQAMSSDHLSEIGKIWQEIGFMDDSEQYQRKHKEIDYNKQILSQVLGEWLSDTKKEQKEMIQVLKKSENSIRDYCEKLKLEETDYFVKNGTLLHRSFEQNKNSEGLHKIISERTERYRLCQESERVILQRLRFSSRTDQKFVPEEANEAVPSEKTIDDFMEHVASLSEREKKREDILINIRTKCVEILIEIEEVSSNMSKFAQNFLFSTELEDLSDEFMESAKKSMEKIKILREEREEKIKDMVGKISAIIQRLEMDEEEETVPDRADLSNKNMEVCTEQLLRLEELKRASMDIMIEKTEEEIMSIEYEIYASELEKLKFERQVLGKISNKEDKLTALENRLEGLKNRYEENIELFESVRIWKECFEELKDLEEKEKDPSRLNNRGGALMKQQKAKRKLLNKMPKLERKIHETAADLGRKCPNLNGNSSVEEFLLGLQEDHEAEKYAEREAKKIEKTHQLMQESKYGVTTSVKKRGANKLIQNSAKRTKPENPILQSSVASSTKTRSTASSSRTAGSNNSLKPTVSSARARTPSKQKQTPQSTPVGRFTPGKQMSSSRVALPASSKKVSHKAGFGFKAPNMKPSSAQREKENVSPSDRFGSARVGRVTEKPKRTAKDRRSKTPDRLTRSKPAGRIFNKLPSSGMRRRSKSVSNLNTITENRFGTNKLSTIVDDSLVSLTSDQFNRDLMSQGRPDSSPFSSSFIVDKRSQHQYAQTP